MKYVVLVSHGEFAQGLRSAVCMLAGEDRSDVLATSLKDGMGANEFAENVKTLLKDVKADDEIILFADIVGGSPLSTAANTIAELGLLPRTTMVGGMNLPLVITTVLSKDDEETSEVIAEALEAAQGQLHEFKIAADDDEDEEL
ncbi:PTS system, N-acetylgalactosamine-specific IIA component [Lachnospiraceae bacterium KH1T2]|jgi:PTS system N-acetylgalactosamine-specific IIA component|nr:PTS system, N-acetylgalactosamine-specific IIA component [Lachnospiraceae bacterium KH1T2]